MSGRREPDRDYFRGTDPDVDRIADATITGPITPLPSLSEVAEGEERIGVSRASTTRASDNPSASTYPSATEGLSGEELRSWDAREDLARAVADRVGIEFEGESVWPVDGRSLKVTVGAVGTAFRRPRPRGLARRP